MKLLVLGGTRFLGRHFVEAALARGHSLTLVHRGRSGAGLFPQAEHHIADRSASLDVLAGGTWDAVIDTSAYFPRQVSIALDALAARIGQYLLVSTISVYATPWRAPVTEDAPRAVLENPTLESVTGETYGGLKALCEDRLLQAMPDRATIVRPGLIVGPHDPTGRFGWWVRRLQRGGTVLAPGDPGAPVQFIDARDAAAFMLHAVESDTTGVFNLNGPTEPLTMGRWLHDGRAALNPEASLEWVANDFLLAQGVTPWTTLPLWLTGDDLALHRTDLTRAVGAGLRCRPLDQTLADTAASDIALNPDFGLAPEREAELLAAWRARDAQ